MADAAQEPASARRGDGRGPGRRLLWLLVLPLVLVGPALLPGARFLPIAPRAYEPLASEDPAAAARALDGANLVASDRLLPFLTDELALRARWLRGELPTRAPELGLGLPLAAGTLVGPWYPPRLLLTPLPPDVASGWSALLALTLAGAGMALFLARRGLSPAAAVLGGLAFQASGYALANLHLPMKLDAALWLPWLLWAVEGVALRARGARPLAFLFAALAFLAGFPPVALFALCLALAWIAARARRSGGSGAPALGARGALATLGFVLLGVLASAVHLVPMRAASAGSLRVPQDAAALASQALPEAALATLALPDAFGDPRAADSGAANPLAWWWTPPDEAARAAAANVVEWDAFAGRLALALALAALLAAPRRAAFPALALLCAVGFACGWPLLRELYRVPGLDLGAPGRALAVAWPCWAWLAALGADAWLAGARGADAPPPRARRARAALSALSLALVLGGGWLWRAYGLGYAGTHARMIAELAEEHGADVKDVLARYATPSGLAAVRDVGLDGLVLAAGGALLALLVILTRRLPRAALTTALGLVVLAEGAAHGRPHVVPRDLGGEALFPPSEALTAVAETAGDGRVLRYDTSESGIEHVLRLARPNLLQAYGVKDLTPYSVFVPRRQVELLALLDPKSRYRTGASRLSDLEQVDHPLLDRLRVTCVLSAVPLEHRALTAIYEREGFHVYRRAGALPPARVVPRLLAARADAAALELLARDGVRAGEAAVFVPDGPGGGDPDELGGLGAPHPGFRPGEVTVRADDGAHYSVAVRDSDGGFLVLHEGWLPGWKATVDGVDAPVLRLDHAFVGVRVPPGSSVVRLKYEPGSLRLGALLSLVACAAAGGWTLLGARRRRAASTAAA